MICEGINPDIFCTISLHSTVFGLRDSGLVPTWAVLRLKCLKLDYNDPSVVL